ncbi:DUF2577 domain-containing protein [Paenibacillus lautus]|uniref:DUF2577 domain-containing protein n=1 Tax=Paenibacillus lautus TaxID=1401 RepID=UPI003D27B593
MLDQIKLAALAAIDASNPVSVMTGTVTNLSPLEVNVDQRFTIDADFLIVPESLQRYEVDLKHKHAYTGGNTEDALDKIVIRKGLELNDIVLLLRVQGGQQFVILDKVVGA